MLMGYTISLIKFGFELKSIEVLAIRMLLQPHLQVMVKAIEGEEEEDQTKSSGT